MPAHAAELSVRRREENTYNLRIYMKKEIKKSIKKTERAKETKSIEYKKKPFPKLTWDGYYWKGEIILRSWKGFQSRLGPYTSVSSDKPSNGRVNVHVDTLSSDDLPSAEQETAFQYLLEQETMVAESALQALLNLYPALRESYGYDNKDMEDDEEAEEYMPVVSNIDGFKPIIGLGIVHVLKEGRDGMAYIGLELGCEWDDHGLGFMMYGNSVVELGSATASFQTGHSCEEWIAVRDKKRSGKKRMEKSSRKRTKKQ
jgi:hypothetical protein